MTFYFGACAGGVWKTTDGGLTWSCITDGSFTTAAIGALAIAPSDSNVIYAGTGEACIRNDVSHGDGVYRSRDAGKTWTHVGLRDTRHIGRILVHPHHPNTVYIAALGHAWGPNGERGVFRSRDGGGSWTRFFSRARAPARTTSLWTAKPGGTLCPHLAGAALPACSCQRGEECGLWRSFDGGDSWQEISRKPGLPNGMLGKIGVAVSQQPVGGSGLGRSWALVEAEDGALFRSDDGGETWDRASEFWACGPGPGITCMSRPIRSTRIRSTSRTTACGNRSTPAALSCRCRPRTGTITRSGLIPRTHDA